MNHNPSLAVSVGVEVPGTAALPISGASRPLPRLLWVDDSRLLLSLYQLVFQSLGFEVLATASPNEALALLPSNGVDVAILDYEMPEMDGGVLASILKERCPMLPVILYSGSDSIPQIAGRWVDAICPKAAPRAELLATIERLSQNPNQEYGNHHLQSFAPSSNH